MSEVVPFSRWRHSLVCISCEVGEVCRCTDDLKGAVWTLNGTDGMIQQFLSDGPYYGKWHGGRTGSMTDLDDCKAAVERAVCHA